MAEFIAWHGETLQEHETLRDQNAKKGFRFLSLSIYGSGGSNSYYAAVMIKRSNVVPQRDFPSLSAQAFQQTFDTQAKEGWGPVILAACGPASNPTFAAVFQPQKPTALCRFGLKNGNDPSDLSSIQGMVAKARKDGLKMIWGASYGDLGNPAFAGIWVPNSTHTLWNVDAVLDDDATRQARFKAQTSGWCRTALITLNQDRRYMQIFVDNQTGEWWSFSGLSPAAYQANFNEYTGKGFFPLGVQAAGTTKDNATFAVTYVKQEDVIQRNFTPTGPVACPPIDDLMKNYMANSPVRQASLSIVHGTKLVFARGYTVAEPGWPVTQPITCFRLASVSKTVTALAIYRLIQNGELHLTDRMQDILNLRTPSGDAPADPNFGKITVANLLNHTSGLQPDAFRDSHAIVQAFQQAGKSATFPINAAQVDAYMAGLGLRNAPDEAEYYNNCGYYFLGRILAKKLNKTTAIDAIQELILNALAIKRIRRAVSLISQQHPDESRYQDPTLWVGQSVMSPDQPLVPSEYGTEQMEYMESAGGLSGATTDLARLVAILVDQNDNPALKRATITEMLGNGIKNIQKWANHTNDLRAGNGFDDVEFSNGQYFAQKGGSLASSGDWIEFNGDWGFMVCWGGVPNAVPHDSYPSFPEVMNIATNYNWSASDLFPQFGMNSL